MNYGMIVFLALGRVQMRQRLLYVAVCLVVTAGKGAINKDGSFRSNYVGCKVLLRGLWVVDTEASLGNVRALREI